MINHVLTAHFVPPAAKLGAGAVVFRVLSSAIERQNTEVIRDAARDEVSIIRRVGVLLPFALEHHLCMESADVILQSESGVARIFIPVTAFCTGLCVADLVGILSRKLKAGKFR